jgi:hypothetical protein
LWLDEGGQDLAEYGIALAVIAFGVAFGSWYIGLIVQGLWEEAGQSVSQVAGGL